MKSFEALSDPTRRKILHMLGKKELAASAIARKFDMTAPAVSQHLKVLKAARLVNMRAVAQKRLYSIDRKGMAKAAEWLRGVTLRKKPKRRNRIRKEKPRRGRSSQKR